MELHDIVRRALSIQDHEKRIAFLDSLTTLDSATKSQIKDLLSKSSPSILNFGTDNSPDNEAWFSSKDSESASIDSQSKVSAAQDSSPVHNELSTMEKESNANKDLAQDLLRFFESPSLVGCIGRIGHFEIRRILGRGAFGIVAEAQDTKLQRIVAIKFLDPELATKSPPRKRFLREARLAAATKQQSIVAVYAVEENPIPYIVMEYISGPNLQEQLDLEGPLEVSEGLCVAAQLAQALAVAHSSGLVHRDIKPANILLETRAPLVVKLSDFGLARAVDDFSLTRSGVIVGTPLYMSPEQITGGTIDGRSDLFSVGSVLYQVLTGRPPFRAHTTMAVLKRVCEDTPRPLNEVQPEIPDKVCKLVNRLLEKSPEKRFQTADELIAEIGVCSKFLQQPDRQFRREKDDLQPAPAAPEVSKVAHGYSIMPRILTVAVALICIAAILINKSWIDHAPKLEPNIQQGTLINSVQIEFLEDSKIVEFRNSDFPVLDTNKPELHLPLADNNPVFVRQVYHISEDHANLGVEKWRFNPEEGVISVRTNVAKSMTFARPDAILSDGVYCVFSGVSAEKPIPDFAGLFAVNGICEPEIEALETSLSMGLLKVTLKIRNRGSATFRKGVLIAVLTADNSPLINRFCDRQHILLPELSPNESHHEMVAWNLDQYEGQSFFCHGHVNFRYHFDENRLCGFKTDSVAFVKNSAVSKPERDKGKWIVGRDDSICLFSPGLSDEEVEVIKQSLGKRSITRIKNLENLDERSSVYVMIMNEHSFSALKNYNPQQLKKCRILGIGFGAAKLFEEMDLENSAGHCAHGFSGVPKAIVQDSSILSEMEFPSPFFLFEPHVIDLANDKLHNDQVFGVLLPKSNAEPLAIQADDRRYATVSRDGSHILVGVDCSPKHWSESLRKVVQAILEHSE